MKNKEKYKNELKDVIKLDGKICGFMKKHDVHRMIGTDWESFCEMDCIACGTALQIWLEEEYEEPEVDWDNVPVGTLVRVRDSEDEKWSWQRFKYISDTIPTHRFVTYDHGRTHETVYACIKHWKYCELAEEV